MNWVVYLISNKINGKGYVGITNTKYKCVQDRFDSHIASASAGGRVSPNGRVYPIHAAIIKYGEENFSIETLDEDLSLEEAQSKEAYWIETLGTYASGEHRNGYNLTWGGEDPDFDPDDGLELEIFDYFR